MGLIINRQMLMASDAQSPALKGKGNSLLHVSSQVVVTTKILSPFPSLSPLSLPSSLILSYKIALLRCHLYSIQFTH